MKGPTSRAWTPPLRAHWTDPALARAVEANLSGRLARFIRDEESEPLAFFTPAWREGESSGDWYGEHAGKWLVAACAAFRRTGDPAIEASLRRAVEFLIGTQEANGYLGTYAADSPSRFTDPRSATVRTWDLWIHAYVILGLLEARDVLDDESSVSAAIRVGDLILASFPKGERSVLDLGNHGGLSSAVLIEPLARLTLSTGEPQYAAFASRILDEMEARGIRVWTDAGGDPSRLGTGKIYQLLWILLGMAVLHRVEEHGETFLAVQAWTDSIAAHHLNPLGGPWGGLGGHKEVFATRGAFDPGGLVETCSTATWIALNRELGLQTGEFKYTERVERSLCNALLGAAMANGEDWSYFTLANGRRTATYHWACCKSSGAMALERSALAMMSYRDGVVRIELPFSGEATFVVDGREVAVVQTWDGERHRVQIRSDAPLELELRVRFPIWCWAGPMGEKTPFPYEDPTEDFELGLKQIWGEDEAWTNELRAKFEVHPYTHSVDHHGQEIVRDDYATLSYGPWVYATGLYEGYRKQETLRLPRLDPASPFRVTTERGEFGPKVEFRVPGRAPIAFWPYAEAGGRTEGGWRATWLGVAWQ